MSLAEVAVHNLRNIEHTKIELSSEVNLFFGENGSGKTSLLEAVYLLSTGKSFRTSTHKNLIKEGQSSCIVSGIVRQHEVQERQISTQIGIAKFPNSSELRINGVTVKQRSELARLLPLLIVTPTSHQLLDAGPHWRRQYLDWGVFHVEHFFGQTWGMYKRGLQQRNSLISEGLRGTRDRDVLSSIDKELGRLGQQIDQSRQAYFASLLPLLVTTVSALLDFEDIQFEFKSGTPSGMDFPEYLVSGLSQDLRRGRTLHGPHTADLKVKIGKYEAKEVLSRGQQKLLVYALLLAQITLFKKQTGRHTTLALDDVSSELDQQRFEQLVWLLKEQFSQLLITSVNKEDLKLQPFSDCAMFHVKHGTVNSI